MAKIIVVLPHQVKGKELLNLITEVTQEVFGDLTVGIKSQSGYVPGPKRTDFIGSEAEINFSIISEENIKRWLSDGYKVRKKITEYMMKLGTPLGAEYLYTVIDFSIYSKWWDEHRSLRLAEVDINQPENDVLRYKFEEFLNLLYSRLGVVDLETDQSGNPLIESIRAR